MKKISLIIAVTLFFAQPVFAVTGKAYLQHCSNLDVNSMDYLRCSSYAVGVIDNMRGNKAGNVGFKDICIPQKTNDAEIVNMTVKWLEANPDALDMWAAFGVTNKVPAVSLGNKCDLKEQQEVDIDEVVNFASVYEDSISYFSSAKTGQNVELAFKKLAENIVKIVID